MPTTQRTRRTLTVGVVLAGAIALGTAPAYADGPASPAPTTSTAAGTPHKVAFCKRVPRIEKRLDKALDRIQGGPDVRGSIQNLQKRIDAQKAKGHTDIATYLQDVLTTRQGLLPQLQQRQADLAKVKTWCATQPQSTPKA